jgi:hypothetical protein
MKGEINKDFYCNFVIDNRHDEPCCDHEEAGIDACLYWDMHGNKCPSFHRKFPIPEQFKEEYGEEYPDDGAVYVRVEDANNPGEYGIWHSPIFGYKDIKSRVYYNIPPQVVCACTPFGPPPVDWRPQ